MFEQFYTVAVLNANELSKTLIVGFQECHLITLYNNTNKKVRPTKALPNPAPNKLRYATTIRNMVRIMQCV